MITSLETGWSSPTNLRCTSEHVLAMPRYIFHSILDITRIPLNPLPTVLCYSRQSLNNIKIYNIRLRGPPLILERNHTNLNFYLDIFTSFFLNASCRGTTSL